MIPLRHILLDTYRAGLLLTLVLLRAVRWAVRRGLRRQSASGLGVWLRELIEDLGITYVKLGQYLALRTDLLPAEICAELDRLFDQARPLAFRDIQNVIERELDGPLGSFFRSVDPEPVGAASIAQVHRAVALDGRVVALKVQRPGVEEIFHSDMRNLLRLARLLDGLGLLGRLSAALVVREFADFTAREFDFIGEAHTAEDLGKDMLAHVTVPQIQWDLTTQRLLTMEFIEGASLLHVCQLWASGRRDEVHRILPGVNLKRVVDDITEVCLNQLFVTGRFHGDPHYGNILIRRDGAAVFIDWGIHGALPEMERVGLSGYCEALAAGDIRSAARFWIGLSTPTSATDLGAYESELATALAGWYAAAKSPVAPAAERHVAKWQGEIVKVMRRNAVRMRKDQLLVWRAITILEASALMLPFRFELLDKLSSFFRRRGSMILEQFVLRAVDYRTTVEYAGMARTAPLQERRILVRSEHDSFRLAVEVQKLREKHRQERQHARVTILALAAVCCGLLSVSIAHRLAADTARVVAGLLFCGALWQSTLELYHRR